MISHSQIVDKLFKTLEEEPESDKSRDYPKSNIRKDDHQHREDDDKDSAYDIPDALKLTH